MAKQPAEVETLEQGNIYFFFRPKVEQEQPEGHTDVANFHVVLSPHGKKLYRMLLIGRERLPDTSQRGKSRVWGFVAQVERDPKTIVDELGPYEYETKTRGERHQPAARPAGEGVYRIVRHGDHTHLVYALELPEQPGEVQSAFAIEPEASYLISVRNPEAPAPRSAGLSSGKRAEFPKDLNERFRGRKFADVDPPEFLDYPGAELIFVSAAQDVENELGITLDPADEDESSAEIFSDLRLRKSERPLEPLFQGEWA